MSAPIRQLSLWQAPKFLVNSRLGLFSATTERSGCETLHLPWLPLSRSYGYILPSSLTRVLPRTLGYSPRIPVSVYGTGDRSLTRSFSWQRKPSSFGDKSPAHHASASVHGFACAPACTLAREHPVSRLPAFLRHSIAQTIPIGAGISTSCPSPMLVASD